MKNQNLDIVIPVYNEGENILDLFRAFEKEVQTPFRVFVCYDFDEDNTLSVLKNETFDFEIVPVKNRGKGVQSAIMSGLDMTNAPAVLVLGADEANNASMIDGMYAKLKEGNDIIVASRLAKGGEMSGGPRLKSLVVRLGSFILHRLAGVPATDATYAWRMFSRRVLDMIQIESTEGFTYAIELLVKCHRLKWPVAEVPARWIMRKSGQSRFNLKKWFPHYAKWFFYALATSYLRKSPGTVQLKPGRSADRIMPIG
ncbi:MAG: glycosyltransferase family 2 protein [Nanoarchaeota archaeon]|nr:glycosyltransferase family 2 protein [Nanoarchaeota archaeon]